MLRLYRLVGLLRYAPKIVPNMTGSTGRCFILPILISLLYMFEPSRVSRLHIYQCAKKGTLPLSTYSKYINAVVPDTQNYAILE